MPLDILTVVYLSKSKRTWVGNKDEIFEDGDDFNDEELENIKKKGQKIRDFDVWSGNYKGAAHLGCVKAMRQQRRQKIGNIPQSSRI